MRKFCLLICISLLSIMFHAVAMPVDTVHAPAPATEAIAAHELHTCSEESAVSTQKACKFSRHLCCSGITAATHTEVLAAVYGTELFNPVLRTMVLQDRPNKQFKPPRLSIRS